MLSIVIPIFNQDVRTLVYTLVKQCNKLNINYQVLCFDDGSEQKYKEFNKELAFKINVNYTEMPENLGRSKIRNWLGKAAYYEDPYLNFQSNNFLIPELLFKENLFDEKVVGYGYEDLLYALDLKKKGIIIRHIENPVIHDGLEINTVFIKKTENAVSNLTKLYIDGKIKHTRLIKSYDRLKDYGLLKSFEWTYTKMEEKIKKNILSENPSISLFNMWKLHLFVEKMNVK